MTTRRITKVSLAPDAVTKKQSKFSLGVPASFSEWLDSNNDGIRLPSIANADDNKVTSVKVPASEGTKLPF